MTKPKPIMDEQEATWADAKMRALQLANKWRARGFQRGGLSERRANECANELEIAFGLKEEMVFTRI